MLNQIETVNQMEKVYSKLERLAKKQIAMGLDAAEKERYIELLGQYIKLKFVLNDDIFNQYIMPRIMFGEAENLFLYIEKKIGWEFDYIFDEKKIETIYNRYIENPEKDLITERIVKLYHILIDNLKDFYKTFKEQDFYKDVSLLFSGDQDDNFEVIVEHFKCKFERLYMILEIEEEV